MPSKLCASEFFGFAASTRLITGSASSILPVRSSSAARRTSTLSFTVGGACAGAMVGVNAVPSSTRTTPAILTNGVSGSANMNDFLKLTSAKYITSQATQADFRMMASKRFFVTFTVVFALLLLVPFTSTSQRQPNVEQKID